MTNFASSLLNDLTSYVNSTAVFSGINKSVISKDFKGGKINNLFGATELDLTHADISGMAVLDISQAFGETKITVPADWRVEVDFTQLFATVDDLRGNKYQSTGTDKILVLTGMSFFAVVEILSV